MAKLVYSFIFLSFFSSCSLLDLQSAIERNPQSNIFTRCSESIENFFTKKEKNPSRRADWIYKKKSNYDPSGDIESYLHLYKDMWSKKDFANDEETKEWMVSKYGKVTGLNLFNTFNELNNLLRTNSENGLFKYASLVPLAYRVLEFEDFAKDIIAQSDDLSEDELLGQFIESLGRKEMYRGISTSEKKNQDILKNGMESIYSLTDEAKIKAQTAIDKYNTSTILDSKVRDYSTFRGQKLPDDDLDGRGLLSRYTPVLSITSDPELASAVASFYKNDFKKVIGTGGKVFVYKLSIPKFFIISPYEFVSVHKSLPKELKIGYEKKLYITNIGIKPRPVAGPQNIESFIFNRIPAQSIVGVTAPQDYGVLPRFSLYPQ